MLSVANKRREDVHKRRLLTGHIHEEGSTMRFLERRGWAPGARTARSMMSSAVATAAIAATALAAAAGCAALPSPAHAEENGPVNWTSLIGGPGAKGSIVGTNADNVNETRALTDGGSIAAGAYDGKALDNPPEGVKGDVDAVLTRLDASGNIVWQQFAGGSKGDFFNSVIDTNDGGFLAVGRTQSEDGDVDGKARGGNDGFIVKFDSEGNQQKAVTFGGSDRDELFSVQHALDGSGYIVVGSTSSTDGDLANANAHGGTDAVIAKLDNDLNVRWVTAIGGSETDKFSAATIVQAAVAPADDGTTVDVTDGYLAVGTTKSTDGDFEGTSLGGDDAVVAKFTLDGQLEWLHTFGGAGDDSATAIDRVPETSVLDQATGITTITNNGYVISGTTDSNEGTFAAQKQTGTADESIDSAFLLRLDAQGETTWANVLEGSADVTGDRVLSTPEGFLLAGTVKANDEGANDTDFTGTQAFGKKDIYVSLYADNGARLNLFTFGGSDDDTLRGLAGGSESNYYLTGATKSADGQFAGMQGRLDGFVISLDSAGLTSYAEEKLLVPVSALKATTDEPSMMSPMLYKDAYVEKSGEQYTVTVYFTDADMMGSTVNSSILGDVSYERDGKMVAADPDFWDLTTHVKSSTMVLKSLDAPVPVNIKGTMGDIRLNFTPGEARPTDIPPYFEPIKVEAPDFPATWKTTFGGTDYEYGADVAKLANGNLAVVGQTYSQDGDFAGLQRGPACAYISIRTAAGEAVKTFELGGLEDNFVAYASSVAATSDGGFIVTGGYTPPEGSAPTGDFAGLATETSTHGGIDGFIARFDAEGNQQWMTGFSGSQHDQIRQVKELADGSFVISAETLSDDGDMGGIAQGLFDVAVAKYSADGQRQWVKSISGGSLDSTDFGLDAMADGNLLITGITVPATDGGTYIPGLDESFGGTFDLCAAKLSTQDGSVQWIHAYGGNADDYLGSAVATSDGGFLVTGQTKSTTNTFGGTGTGYMNSFLMKCNAAGDVEWSRFIKSTEASEGRRILELDDRYVLVGDSRGTDFDFKGLNKGSSDVFVAEYTKDGDRTKLENIGGTLDEYTVQVMAPNDYQVLVLSDAESNDGDWTDMNQGKSDSALLAYDYREAPVDTSALEELVGKAQALTEADYSPETWAVLAKQLSAAQELLASENATQKDIDAAAVQLQLALDGLAPAKTPDPEPNPDPDPDNPKDPSNPGDGDDGDGGEQPGDGTDDPNGDQGSDPDGNAPIAGTGNGTPNGTGGAGAGTPVAGNGSAGGTATKALASTGDPTALVAGTALLGAVAAATAAGMALKRRCREHTR